MRMHWYWACLGAGALTIAAAACSPSASERPAADAAKTPDVKAAASQSAQSDSGHLNLEEIFPAGAGRDLVLETCQTCHTFVPLVVLQKDQGAWNHWAVDHRERVSNLTEDEFKTLSGYLVTNFGPHRPVPQLPAEFLETWTSY